MFDRMGLRQGPFHLDDHRTSQSRFRHHEMIALGSHLNAPRELADVTQLCHENVCFKRSREKRCGLRMPDRQMNLERFAQHAIRALLRLRCPPLSVSSDERDLTVESSLRAVPGPAFRAPRSSRTTIRLPPGDTVSRRRPFVLAKRRTNRTMSRSSARNVAADECLKMDTEQRWIQSYVDETVRTCIVCRCLSSATVQTLRYQAIEAAANRPHAKRCGAGAASQLASIYWHMTSRAVIAEMYDSICSSWSRRPEWERQAQCLRTWRSPRRSLVDQRFALAARRANDSHSRFTRLLIARSKRCSG